MTTSNIKNKLLVYNWQPWLRRPFYGFMMSTFCGGNTKSAFKKIGLPGWECDFLLSDSEWYSADECYNSAKPTILKWFQKHSVTEISERLETSRLLWMEEIKQWSKNPKEENSKRLKRLDTILREITTYVWAVHAAEHFFTPLLKQKVAKYIHKDVEKFIGDASFPAKPNAAEQMVINYKNGASEKLLAQNYSWMRARDGFSRPYKTKEIVDIARHALKQPKHSHPPIPHPLEKIISEARELVYLRMLRMDVYYELMFWAKPVLKETAGKLSIPFEQLKYYTLESLFKGKPKYYPPNFTCASIKQKCYYLDGPLFEKQNNSIVNEFKGTVAQSGYAKGRVKVLLNVKDISKVKKGDILVTYMTSPNFLPAMKLASAFVTNEGGLTCHAAIVAREMEKPCVIGTKIATKVLKDGDIIEVDANKGIIRKIR